MSNPCGVLDAAEQREVAVCKKFLFRLRMVSRVNLLNGDVIKWIPYGRLP